MGLDARDIARRAIDIVESAVEHSNTSLVAAKECMDHGESYIATDIALSMANKRGISWPDDLLSDLTKFREFYGIDDGLEELIAEQEKLKVRAAQ